MKFPIYVDMRLRRVDFPCLALIKKWPESFWVTPANGGPDYVAYLVTPEFWAWLLAKMRKLRHENKHGESPEFAAAAKRFARLSKLVSESFTDDEASAAQSRSKITALPKPRKPKPLPEIIDDIKVEPTVNDGSPFWWIRRSKTDYGDGVSMPENIKGTLHNKFFPHAYRRTRIGLVYYVEMLLMDGGNVPKEVMRRHKVRVRLLGDKIVAKIRKLIAKGDHHGKVGHMHRHKAKKQSQLGPATLSRG